MYTLKRYICKKTYTNEKSISNFFQFSFFSIFQTIIIIKGAQRIKINSQLKVFYLLFNIFGTGHGYFGWESTPELLDFSCLCLDKADVRAIPTDRIGIPDPLEIPSNHWERSVGVAVGLRNV